MTTIRHILGGGPPFHPYGAIRLLVAFWALSAAMTPCDAAAQNLSQTEQSEAARRPNILLIVGDDHRGGTLGIDGDPRQATPSLDKLAGQGVRFNRAYCNSPVCTPSRQSFITGKLPHAVGVTLLTTALPKSAVTLGDWLLKHDYETAAFGKMHFNSKARHGFTTRVDLPEWSKWLAKHPPQGGDHRRPWRPFVDPSATWLNAHCHDAGLPTASMDATYLADQVIDFIREPRDRPFLAVVGFYEPHSPFRFPREWSGRFLPRDFSAPPVSAQDAHDRPKIFRSLTERDTQAIQAAYFTSLSFLDHQVGRIVEALAASGKGKDTIVVYLGDNGYMLGEHGRFEKHCFYEPAVRVPLLIRWRGHLPEGRTVNGMVEFVDLFPTLVDLIGVERPPGLQGQSLVPLLKATPGATSRDIVFSEYLENEEAMVRDERYKLVVGTGRRQRRDGYETGHPLQGPYERLFDMQTDPDETTNLTDRPDLSPIKSRLLENLYQRLVTTRDKKSQVPPGLTPMQSIHWCLVPRDPEPGPNRE